MQLFFNVSKFGGEYKADLTEQTKGTCLLGVRDGGPVRRVLCGCCSLVVPCILQAAVVWWDESQG